MSGGHFNYLQFQIEDVSNSVLELKTADFPIELGVLERLDQIAQMVKQAGDALHCLDWYISGDVGVDNFNKMWKERGLPKIKGD